MTNQPFNYTGPPPPNGYGFQIVSQGGQLTGKNLLCNHCGSLVADEPFYKDAHDRLHNTQKLLLETVENLTAEVKKLRSQYVIQEDQ